ncbi:MAG: hypothetical protein ORN83_12280, partial [Chthoniobacteraceae bacterium]|nr:hypothetical protein [Chthoniobacteraceae bacterium]
DYPAPIVEDKAATKAAKDRMYGLRKSNRAREEAQDVQERHGSRKSGLPPSGSRRKAPAKRATKSAPKTTPPPSQQEDLFTWSGTSTP